MKRLWLILLSIGLLTVFSTAAFAVDVKFSGDMSVAGVYLNKTSLTSDTSPSTAFYYQRLRVRTDLVVSPGLTVITRADVMERILGGARTAAGTTLATDSSGTTAENENIAIDWAYINYQSPIGIFDVGIMNDGSTGTVFGNSLAPAARIKYSYTAGPATLNLAYTKVKEQSYNSGNAVTYADADNDKYGIEGVYKWKGGLAGLQVNYYRYAELRPATSTTPNTRRVYTLFTPYTIAKFGPVNVQAELNWATGKLTEYDTGITGTDVTLQNMSGWIDAQATFGAVYFGGTFAYVSGDDPNTADKNEGGILNGGRDWSPNLIMWSQERSYWIGNISSTAVGANNGFGSSFGSAYATTSTKTNGGLLYQGRVGVKPTDKLDIMTSFTYADADKTPANYVSKNYGYELDVVATYKLTSNLSYMLGAGYLWTGDYFKATSSANSVQNDYLVINKLTLTF